MTEDEIREKIDEQLGEIAETIPYDHNSRGLCEYVLEAVANEPAYVAMLERVNSERCLKQTKQRVDEAMAELDKAVANEAALLREFDSAAFERVAAKIALLKEQARETLQYQIMNTREAALSGKRGAARLQPPGCRDCEMAEFLEFSGQT